MEQKIKHCGFIEILYVKIHEKFFVLKLIKH